MDLHYSLFDGQPRPSWAGPVTATTRKRILRPGKRSRHIELSGVVLPVEVHPRHIPSGSRGHTSGLQLGFPDLSEGLLHPGKRPDLSKHWTGIEQAIAESAARTMGWGGHAKSYQLPHAGVPDRALHLCIAGEMPEEGDPDEEEPGAGKFGNALRMKSITGELTKLFPIRDPSGTRVRMQRVGSPSLFLVDPFSAGWSRDPRAL